VCHRFIAICDACLLITVTLKLHLFSIEQHSHPYVRERETFVFFYSLETVTGGNVEDKRDKFYSQYREHLLFVQHM